MKEVYSVYSSLLSEFYFVRARSAEEACKLAEEAVFAKSPHLKEEDDDGPVDLMMDAEPLFDDDDDVIEAEEFR